MPLYISGLPLNTDFDGLIDGNFDFWTINTSFAVAASDVYTSDAWIANAGTGGAATVSQDTPIVGSEPLWMTTPRKFRAKFTQTANASTAPTYGEKITSVRAYEGDSICISGTFAAAVNGSPITAVQLTQNFGTGGAPSAPVITTVNVAWPLTTAESFQYVQLNVPSISGKTLGTNGNDYLRIDLVMATGATFTVYFSQIQIDQNGPLLFRYRGIELEKLRLSTWLYTIGPINSPLGFCNGFCNSGGSSVAWLFLPVTMRAALAVSVQGGGITTVGYTSAGGTVSGTATVGSLSGSKSVLQFSGSAFSGAQPGAAAYFSASAPSSTIIIDARP